MGGLDALYDCVQSSSNSTRRTKQIEGPCHSETKEGGGLQPKIDKQKEQADRLRPDLYVNILGLGLGIVYYGILNKSET